MSDIIAAIGLILAFLGVIYLAPGIAMTTMLRRGIRKIWAETDDLKDRWILWAYLITPIVWPAVDWNNVEVQNNWALLQEGKKREGKEDV